MLYSVRAYLRAAREHNARECEREVCAELGRGGGLQSLKAERQRGSEVASHALAELEQKRGRDNVRDRNKSEITMNKRAEKGRTWGGIQRERRRARDRGDRAPWKQSASEMGEQGRIEDKEETKRNEKINRNK